MQTEIQAGRQASRHTGKPTDRQANRQTSQQTGKPTERQANRQASQQTGKQTCRQAYRQRNDMMWQHLPTILIQLTTSMAVCSPLKFFNSRRQTLNDLGRTSSTHIVAASVTASFFPLCTIVAYTSGFPPKFCVQNIKQIDFQNIETTSKGIS